MDYEVKCFRVGYPNLPAVRVCRDIEQHGADVADALHDFRNFRRRVYDEHIIIRETERDCGGPVAILEILPTTVRAADNRALLGNGRIRNAEKIQLPRTTKAHRIFAGDSGGAIAGEKHAGVNVTA